MTSRSLLLSTAIVLSGCSSAVNGDYPGDAQFSIRGAISGPAPSPAPARPTLGIYWYKFVGNGDAVAGDVLPIASSSFPGQFSFDLLSLPPDSILNPFNTQAGTTDGEIAFGYIVAFDDVDGDGTFVPRQGGDGITAPDRRIGAINDHLVVYVKSAPSAASPAARMFTDVAALTPGYHLTAGVCKTSGTYDTLMPVAADTTLELLVGDDVPESHCINVF